MIPCLMLLAAVGGTTFIPETDLGFDAFIKGWNAPRLMSGLRHIDIDENGTPDIVRTDAVLFMKEGRCIGSAPLPVDAAAELPEADFWRRDLYLVDNKTLRVFRWENGSWQKKHEQPFNLNSRRLADDFLVEDPAPDEETGVPPSAVSLSRFLHDINGDGVPEAAWVVWEGMEVWVQRDGAYAYAGTADILPPLRPSEWRSRDMDRRALAFGSRRMVCGVSLLGPDLSVRDYESLLGETRVRIHSTRYKLSIGAAGLATEMADVSVTPPLPASTSALRLNGDAIQDYVGDDVRFSRSSAAPIPIKTLWVSTDAGKTLQTFRSTTTDRGPNFVDFDGDGDLDMFVHRVRLFEGGVRELLARALTSRRVQHEIGVHLQDAQGRFSKNPGFRWQGTVELDSPPWDRSEYFFAYLDSQLTQVDGDYNGDDRKDLAVHDRLNRIAVYLSGPEGYPSQPQATVPASETMTFSNCDVDGDGRSDLILADSGTHIVKHVYFSREMRP